MPDEHRIDADERRYSDREVRVLLERASRVQPSGTPAQRKQEGLTLAQLEDVAAEAGIDVALLKQAARELELERNAQPPGIIDRLAGAPLRLYMERTLPFEADEGVLGLLVDSIGAVMSDAGETTVSARTFSWQLTVVSGRRTAVRVAVGAGRTHVRVEERYSELAGTVFGSMIGGIGGGLGIGGGAVLAGTIGAFALAVPVVVITGSYAASRAGFSAYVRRRARLLDRLCDRIVQDLITIHGA